MGTCPYAHNDVHRFAKNYKQIWSSYMRNDKVFFHIKQIFYRGCSNLSEFRSKLLLDCSKKLSDGVTLAYLNYKMIKTRRCNYYYLEILANGNLLKT
jgi:hypothetical protein